MGGGSPNGGVGAVLRHNHADSNGGALAAQRNPAEALKSYQGAHATFERLAKAAPNNQAAQRELAVSWSNLASAHTASGAPAEGLNALKRGQAVMANLVRLAPDNAEWKLALSRLNEQIAAAPR